MKKSPLFEKRYLSVNETAQLLGVSTISVYRYVKTGLLKASRLRSLIRIDKLWLEKFLADSARLVENRPRVKAQDQK